MERRKKFILFALVLFIGIGLDQLTKFVARDHFVLAVYSDDDVEGLQVTGGRQVQAGMCKRPADDIPVLGRLFRFTYAENDGAFLSLGATWDPTIRLIVLTILPGILLLGVLVYMLASDKVGRSESWAFSLIAAGGIGNIIDRVAAGWVVDFMHMDFWGITQTGVFNVADLYIMAGIGVYLVAYFKQIRSEKEDGGDTSQTDLT
jgi:signal peptidase II